MEEIWKEVKIDNISRYEISSYGNVRLKNGNLWFVENNIMVILQ